MESLAGTSGMQTMDVVDFMDTVDPAARQARWTGMEKDRRTSGFWRLDDFREAWEL